MQRTPLPEVCSPCCPLPPDDAEEAEAAASIATLSRRLLFLQMGIVQRRVKK